MRIALVTVCQCEIGRMPIGILCLHAWIRHHLPQHEIHIVDAGFVNPLDVLLYEDWDLVGISSMTPEYEVATDLAKNLKKQKPKLPIIIGGQHITALPKSLRSCFDLGIMGEGEATFAEVIESGISNLSQIKGIVWHGPDGVVVNPGREPISLEGYPHLHYDAIDQRYFESHAIPLFARFVGQAINFRSLSLQFHSVENATTVWGELKKHGGHSGPPLAHLCRCQPFTPAGKAD